MLKSVLIENFQSHARTELTFCPGVNAIVGASDSGKSAVVRALLWPITNRPLGDSFRSTWGGDTRVRIDTVEGRYVTRRRTKTANTYEVDGITMPSASRDVPDQVVRALLITPVNIQRQMDAPFMLSETAGAVASGLNEAADLSLIDSTLATLTRSERESNDKLARAEREACEASKAIPDLARLQRARTELDKAQALEAACKARFDRRTALMQAALTIANQPAPTTVDIEFVQAILDKCDAATTQNSTSTLKVCELVSLLDMIRQHAKPITRVDAVRVSAQIERVKEMLSGDRSARISEIKLVLRGIPGPVLALPEIPKLEARIAELAAKLKPCAACGAPADWKERVR